MRKCVCWSRSLQTSGSSKLNRRACLVWCVYCCSKYYSGVCFVLLIRRLLSRSFLHREMGRLLWRLFHKHTSIIWYVENKLFQSDLDHDHKHELHTLYNLDIIYVYVYIDGFYMIIFTICYAHVHVCLLASQCNIFFINPGHTWPFDRMKVILKLSWMMSPSLLRSIWWHPCNQSRRTLSRRHVCCQLIPLSLVSPCVRVQETYIYIYDNQTMHM